MMPSEVVKLCRLVKAVCPSQAFDTYTPDAWVTLLGDRAYDDAVAAVQNLAKLPLEPGKARYIEPGHIIGEIRRIHAKRLTGPSIGEPPAGLNPTEYRQWLIRSRAGAVTGQPLPQPSLGRPADPARVAEILAEARQAPPTAPHTKTPATAESSVDAEALEAERQRQLAAIQARIAQDGDRR